METSEVIKTNESLDRLWRYSPCPFCGSLSAVMLVKDDNGYKVICNAAFESEGGTGYGCGGATGWYSTPSEAEVYWGFYRRGGIVGDSKRTNK